MKASDNVVFSHFFASSFCKCRIKVSIHVCIFDVLQRERQAKRTWGEMESSC